MDNVGFVVAAYSVTFVIVVGYTLTLARRIARARRDAERLGNDP